MKFVINAVRDNSEDSWGGYIGNDYVTACPFDVDELFAGLTRAIRARFEISNVRPRYFDYHTFAWMGISYMATEITGSEDAPCLTSHISERIREFFEKKGQKCAYVYISIYQ